MGIDEGRNLRFTYLALGLIVTISLFSIFFINEKGLVGNVVRIFSGNEDLGRDLVLNMTFDNSQNVSQDYSSLNHVFAVQGTAKYVNSTYCKWYGCLNLTKDGGDYINSSTKFTLNNGMSVCFWEYLLQEDTQTYPQFYFQMGPDNSNLKAIEENQYGPAAIWRASNGTINLGTSDVSTSPYATWTHYCFSYNKTKGMIIWRDGVVKQNSTTYYGNLNYSVGELIKIGEGRYDDSQIFLDEFLLWNTSIEQDIVDELYNSQRLGTPPTLDLYVKAIKYNLSAEIDWSSQNNTLNTAGTMPIKITIANAGTTNSGAFDYNLTLDDAAVCSGTTSINALSEVNITCNWNKAIGFHKGFMFIDILNSQVEDIETNNNQRVYVPFMNRPFIHFNLTEFTTILKPYCANSSNTVAYSSCSWMASFTSENFNEAWTGNDVDPRGKKARENAMGCMYNGYPNSNQCKYAFNHLSGWGNRTLSSYAYVQAIHELVNLGMVFDIMFPNMTQQQYELYSQQYHDICQQITNLPNTRPDLDDDSDLTQGGNGFGFGSGMGGFCYAMIGAYSDNPTLIQETDQSYWGKNIPDEWMDREKAYLRAYKNDSESQYQEGWLYKAYSQAHLVENFLFEKRMGLDITTDYQNALCAMGKELVRVETDTTYSGNVLRNDISKKARFIQRGDSMSYGTPYSGFWLDWDIPLYYGLLCDDSNVKSSMLWLRQQAYNTTDGRNTYPASYLYKQLVEQASIQSPENTLPKFSFDNANDIFFLRTNYSYVNDTIIQIDGGEERGSGHSQAQGYYLYALGEPFIDYEQVPYEDDVRAETWKNGVSLQNDTQTAEGQLGFYSATCGNAPLNQYYGMSTCEIEGTYPNFRNFPLQYGGDVEDYIGTADANFAGAYVWRPYKNSNPVQEYFVKFGDVLIKRTKVSGVTEGKGIYHNFINVNSEFTESSNGLNFTFTRDSKNLKTQITYSSQALILGGGATNVNLCFAKTDCSGSNRGNSKYRRMYYYANANNLDMLFTQHWYTTSYQDILALNGTDKGIIQGNNVVVFDWNNDQLTQYGIKSSNGWALAYNNMTGEIASFNTTQINDSNVNLFESNIPISVHLKSSSDDIVLTANTNIRSGYIDYPAIATVTIDAQSLTGSDFVVMKGEDMVSSSSVGTKVTFSVQSSQNSDTYTITATGDDITPPLVSQITNESTTNQSTFIKAVSNEIANLTVRWGYSVSNLINTVTNTTYRAISRVFFFGLNASSTIYYNTTSCDIARNCVNNGTFSFQTSVNTYDTSSPSIISVVNTTLTPYGFRVALELNESGTAVTYVSLYRNLSNPLTFNSTEQSSHNILVNGLSNNTFYFWKVNGSDSYGNFYNSQIYNVTTSQVLPSYPNFTNFNGNTTNFYSVSNIASVQNPVLEDTNYGRITFNGTVNMSDLNLDSYITISNAQISLNSNSLPRLNISAFLRIYGLSFANVKIMMDGSLCPPSICTFVSYSGGVLVFNVSHFTTYSAQDNTTEESDEEDSSGGGGGGGGGGSSPIVASKINNSINATKNQSVETQNEILEIIKDITNPVQANLTQSQEESPKPVTKDNKQILEISAIGVLLLAALILSLIYFKKKSTPITKEEKSKELELPNGKKAANLLELAKALNVMTDAEFQILILNNKMQEWIAEYLFDAKTAGLLMNVKTKEEAYAILYKILKKNEMMEV